ncbi:MAG TPA: ABC transporter ATP-binding protein [Clostridia bacterium]|nr:ABC transporter ATP-binding protein [Clostridia bacterium]
MILKGSESEKFMKRINTADHKEAQLIMAKFTGNFKHGNE